MAGTRKHDPQYLIQEPTSGLYVSGEQPVYMVGGARLSKRPEAARFATHADAALALQDLPRAALPMEIVRADA